MYSSESFLRPLEPITAESYGKFVLASLCVEVIRPLKALEKKKLYLRLLMLPADAALLPGDSGRGYCYAFVRSWLDDFIEAGNSIKSSLLTDNSYLIIFPRYQDGHEGSLTKTSGTSLQYPLCFHRRLHGMHSPEELE